MKTAKLYAFTAVLACTVIISACNNHNSPKSNSGAATRPTHQAKENTPPTAPSSKSIELGADHYVIPLNDERTERFNFAVKTAAGIVWVPAPMMKLAEGSASFYYPTGPFTFFLSPPGETTLVAETSQQLTALPLNDGEARLIVEDVFGYGDYILYHTSSIFTDGAQPLRQQAWVMNVSNPVYNKPISEFHSTGGKSYSYATDEQAGLYISVSTVPGNPDGSSIYEVYVYDVNTGVKDKLQDYSLNEQSLDSIEFSYSGKKYSYTLTAK